jgi:hypothetical protein
MSSNLAWEERSAFTDGEILKVGVGTKGEDVLGF